MKDVFRIQTITHQNIKVNFIRLWDNFLACSYENYEFLTTISALFKALTNKTSLKSKKYYHLFYINDLITNYKDDPLNSYISCPYSWLLKYSDITDKDIRSLQIYRLDSYSFISEVNFVYKKIRFNNTDSLKFIVNQILDNYNSPSIN